MTRIVILGGGPAGYEAALVAGELGADVTIVTDEGLGGNGVLWDVVPSKALIVAAEAMGWLHTANLLGVHVAGMDATTRCRPTGPSWTSRSCPSASSASGPPSRPTSSARSPVRASSSCAAAGASRATTRSPPRWRTAPSESCPPTTSWWRRAPGPASCRSSNPTASGCSSGQQVYGLPEVPEHLIVVGSGATGAEFAHAFVRFGSKVTLVSSRELILPTEDPDAAQVIEDVFERRGMTILRRSRAVSCTPDADGVTVGLKDGGEVRGSHVLFTVGQVPVSSELGLDVCGVETNEWGGIDVDAVGRSSCRWVYAAGDVVGRVMLASVAAMQGRVAMWHALGQAVTPIRWDAVAATIFTDPEVATVGLSPQDAEAASIPYITARLDFAGNPRAKMADTTDGFVKVHAMRGSGIVLGAVIVSARASDLIQPLAVAVQNRLTVAQLAQTIAVYPSMQGSVAECARMLMARLEQPV